MDLTKLMIDTREVWIDYPAIDNFSVKVAHLSRSELNNLRKACTVTFYDRKERKSVDKLDDDKFIEEFTRKTVKGWKGLTLNDIQSLLLVDIGELDPKDEIEYDEATAEQLVRHSIEFDLWLNEVAFDLDNFRIGTKRSSVKGVEKAVRESGPKNN